MSQPEQSTNSAPEGRLIGQHPYVLIEVVNGNGLAVEAGGLDKVEALNVVRHVFAGMKVENSLEPKTIVVAEDGGHHDLG